MANPSDSPFTAASTTTTTHDNPTSAPALKRKRNSQGASLTTLPPVAIHLILDYAPSQRTKILHHHICRSFFQCQYPWSQFYVPQRIIENRATGAAHGAAWWNRLNDKQGLDLGSPVLFERHHPNASLVQHSDVLDTTIHATATAPPEGAEVTAKHSSSLRHSCSSNIVEPFIHLNAVSAPSTHATGAPIQQHIHFARQFLALSPHWNFQECHTLILHQYNVFTIRIMDAFRIVSPALKSIRFIKVPLNYLTAQEIRRLQRRIQLLNLNIIEEEKVLPMCKCKRMLSIQDTGYCFACAPTLTEASNLAQRFLIEGGMKAVALKNYYYNE